MVSEQAAALRDQPHKHDIRQSKSEPGVYDAIYIKFKNILIQVRVRVTSGRGFWGPVMFCFLGLFSWVCSL